MGTEPAPTDSTNHLASGFYPLTLFADFYASALATHLVSGGSAGPHLVDQSSLERPTGEPRAVSEKAREVLRPFESKTLGGGGQLARSLLRGRMRPRLRDGVNHIKLPT
ncbi:hypothetical protein GW17_00038026 [Ensete ventricosum]|nr:hypothetical protein GW17_00038026 [Ensete ventricosum]RZR79475.1 hypothetical protein BHM03_00005204 [Ensete ventricosum]